MCLCHHAAEGNTPPTHHCLLAQVLPFHSVSLFFPLLLHPDRHNVRKPGKAGVRNKEGIPGHAMLLVRAGLCLRILPKAFGLWKRRDLG